MVKGFASPEDGRAAPRRQPRDQHHRAAAAGSGNPPFAHLAPALTCAALYGLAALAWALGGAVLPGGRWLAVHLFTLGALSNAVLAMTEHFSATLTRSPRDGRSWQRWASFNVGALAVLVGFPTGHRALLIAGATLTSGAVLWLYLALRRMRTRSLGARFAFVVRAYERAAAAFLHGAVLGALMGTGVLGGEWYGAVRLAHLAVNVLGWGGLVLLATVVFFGPTLLRTRMAPNAQRLAAPALRVGATALTVAVVALIVTGADGAVGMTARSVAVLGLAVYAAAATAVCGPVLRSARRAVPSAHGRMIAAACGWFPLAAWVGAATIAVDHRSLLNAVGLALVLGVLGQAIVAAMSYLLPMAAGSGPEARAAIRQGLERLAGARAAVFNVGAAAVVGGHAVATLTAADATVALAAGWALLAAAVGSTTAFAVAGVHTARRTTPVPPSSA